MYCTCQRAPMDPRIDFSLLMPPSRAPRRPRSPSPTTEGLGPRLARLRKERGFTQVELAKKMGIIQALISDYENEKLRPNTDVLVRYALAHDVSTDQILGLDKPAKPPALSSVSRRLLRRLQQFDKLPKRDQDALLRTIDAFLGRQSAA